MFAFSSLSCQREKIPSTSQGTTHMHAYKYIEQELGWRRRRRPKLPGTRYAIQRRKGTFCSSFLDFILSSSFCNSTVVGWGGVFVP
jgi:hypothetical protein